MACASLTTYSRNCSKATKAGFNPNVYGISYGDLSFVTGTTEVFTVSVTGLITAINLKAPTTVKFVPIGTVVNQGSIKETYTYNENGTYDIVKELQIAISGMGDIEGNTLISSFMSNPSAFLIKLNSGKWVVLGLNGQFILKTSEGTIDNANNGRVATISGSDTELLQPVDPTIIAALLTAIV